jgi:hypothetical protein
MARMRWVMIEGKLIPADEVTANAEPKGPTILADLPDFRSSIDGSIVRGRAGMRDHCARHDVVPNQELAGLKPRVFGQGVTLSPQEREARKRTMYQILDQRYHNHIK